MGAEVWGVIGAFAGAWIALLALGVTAFLWLMSAIQNNGRENRAEIRALREDNKAENRILREEHKAEMRAFRENHKAEMRAFRENYKAEMQAFREEYKAENSELRAELRAEIRAEGQERRAETQRFFDALYRHRHENEGAIYVPGDDD